MKDARKRDIIFSKMSRKSVALASHIYILKFLCKDGMLSSRHMMSLKYVKKKNKILQDYLLLDF